MPLPENVQRLVFLLPRDRFAELDIPLELSAADVTALCGQLDCLRAVLMAQVPGGRGPRIQFLAPPEGGS